LTVNVCPAALIVPVRAAPVFAATVNAVEPLPVPEPPAVIVIHEEPAAFAVHAQVGADAVIAIVPEPPVSVTFCELGEIENVHGGGGAGGADCVTEKVFPATLIVPLRSAPVFASTRNVTVPLPVPALPFVTAIHDAFDVAVHAQLDADAVTVTEPTTVASETVWELGSMVKVQAGGGGAADWVTEKVLPATVIVPDRSAPVLAPMLNVAEPLPVPEPCVTVIHDAFEIAVHPHDPADALTVTAPVAAVFEKLWLAGEIVKVHAGGGGGGVAGTAAWATVKVLPAAAIVPVLASPVFALARNATVPLPLPLVPLVTAIHPAFGAAVHAQPDGAVTLNVPVDTSCDTFTLAGEIV
jgi:hypothetical protein